ncbi:MAG TPA: hypothetical protein VMN39_12965 [Longimicrobiaceae bacterium]|nr:hypothetical protein [Longimicrobiaceae bacterium]
MSDATVPEAADGWSKRLRQTPTGMLLISALLAIIGFGSLFAGVYLLMEQRQVSYWGVATGMIGGPALLYLAYHLVRFTRWTWLALIVLLALMAASSVLRLVVAPGLGIAPAVELIIEAAAAYYLMRPGIRSRFGWTGA